MDALADADLMKRIENAYSIAKHGKAYLGDEMGKAITSGQRAAHSANEWLLLRAEARKRGLLPALQKPRADLCADPALLAEAVEVLRDAVAAWELHNKTGDMMQGHWAGDARFLLNKLENRHDR